MSDESDASNDLFSRRTVLTAAGASIAATPFLTGSAFAADCFSGGSECAEYTAYMKDANGNVLETYQIPEGEDDFKTTVPADEVGDVLDVVGKYVELRIDLDTFTVWNYTITDDNPCMTENEDVVVFKSKEPQHDKTLDSGLEIRLKECGIIAERSSSEGLDMKVQSKNATQGGIFQMEPESDTSATTDVVHTLGEGLHYYFEDDGDLLLTTGPHGMSEGDVIARESPEFSTLVSDTQHGDTTSRWRIDNGGRAGFVAGEDATTQ